MWRVYRLLSSFIYAVHLLTVKVPFVAPYDHAFTNPIKHKKVKCAPHSEAIRPSNHQSLYSRYYEPAHSIFCNTVHLYLWLVLLIIPLVVGLVTSGAFNLSLLIGYTCFIGALFAILKVSVCFFIPVGVHDKIPYCLDVGFPRPCRLRYI